MTLVSSFFKVEWHPVRVLPSLSRLSPGREAAFPYFYAPVGLLLLSNVVLFLNSLRGVRSALEQRAEEEQGLNTELAQSPYSKAQRRIDM